MAVQVKPQPQFQFGGVNLSGHPLDRPYGTASICENLRVMKGNWLRLRGGRRARVNGTNILDIKAMHRVELAGSSVHFVVPRYSGPTVKVCKLTVPATLDETGVETLSSSFDGNINDEHRHPICTLADSVIWYNGKGYRTRDDVATEVVASGSADATPTSVPPFTQWKAAWTGPQYFGLLPLDKFNAISTNLEVQFSAGAGNNVSTGEIEIFVGLYNASTNHYSNGVSAGTLASTAGVSGTFTVSGLNMLQVPYMNTFERDNLYFVYYATLQDRRVPYLILNAAQDGPLTTAYNGASTQSLSVASSTDNGWVLDLTHEMPTHNYPPRPSKCIWYVGGRLYNLLSESHGALASTVSQVYSSASGTVGVNYVAGTQNGVEYDYTARELAGVFWSGAEGSVRKIDFLGDPLQSWDPRNFEGTPTGETPLWGTAAPDDVTSVVWTGTRTHLLREQENNVHEWDTASQTHGLSKHANGPRTVQTSRHGIIWLTQRNQIALMDQDLKVQIISSDYDAILQGCTPRCGLYVYDPVNEIDRYMLFVTDASNIERAICHDFLTGMYYTREPHRVTFAQMLQSSTGDEYFMAAAGSAADNYSGFYTIEGQPDSSPPYLVPARDELFNSGSSSLSSALFITDGYYAPNWSAFGDASNRKEIPWIDIIGDNEISSGIGARPMSVEWFKGFASAVAAASGTQLALDSIEQEPARSYRFDIALKHGHWWKFIIRLRPHHTDLPTIYYPRHWFEGDYASNFYGSIMALLFSIGPGQNRR